MSSRKENLEKAVQLLIARKQSLGGEMANLPTKVTDTSLYLAFRVDGKSSIVKLTNDETKKVIGVTNFEGNRLAKGRDAIIDSMKITVAQDGLNVADVDWKGAAINAPSALLNAELKLVQKNDILLNIPVSDLILENNCDNYRDIASKPFLVADTPIEWILEFADGSSIPAEAVNGVFFKIEMRAIQAIQ